MARIANRMTEAVAVLGTKFAANASIVVAYSNGVSSVSDVSATVSRTLYEELEGEVPVLHESRDYIIQASLLVIGGVAVTPDTGHRITEADGTIYEVMSPPGMNVYERIGPTRAVLRIHTKGPM